MKKLYLFILLFTLVLSDIALINISFFLGLHLTNKFMVDINPDLYRQNIWSCTIIWLISSGIFRLYTFKSLKTLKSLYFSTFGSTTLYAFLFAGFLVYTNQTTFPVELLATILPLAGMAFVLSRLTATAIEEVPLKVSNTKNKTSLV